MTSNRKWNLLVDRRREGGERRRI